MKPRLSAALLSALLAAAPAVHAAASDIQPEYGTPKSLKGNVTGKSSVGEKAAYQLTGDVTLTAIKKGSEVDSFYKSGDFYFTSASTRSALIFNAHEEKNIGDPGISRVFYESSVTFKDLSKLEMAYDSTRYTYAPGAFANFSNGVNLIFGNIGEVNFKKVAVKSKNADAFGGLINGRGWGQTWFTDSSTVNFEEIAIVNKKEENQNKGLGHVGGGVISSGGQLNFRRNGSLSFKGNSVYVNPDASKEITDVMNAYGGAIDLWRSTADFSSNTTILFEGNIARSNTGSSYGGAISLFDCTTDVRKTTGSEMTFSKNGNVSFTGNWVYGKNGSYGGAIAASTGDSVKFSQNTGKVSFTNNRATRKGGALYAESNAESNAEINITGNNEVEFKGNRVSEGAGGVINNSTTKVNDLIYGGAVYTEADFTIANNDSVIFENNFLHSSKRSEGAAIWIGNDASLIIEGNKEVIFRNNYHVYEPSNYKYYRLGSIYGNNAKAQNIFSAQTDGYIRFEDAVYLMGDLAVNSSYMDNAGNEVLAGGDVIFTGANASAYLTNHDKEKGTTYLTESVTSTLGGDVTVHGGSLQVKSGAIVNIGGELNVTGSADNVANVQVGAGTLNVGSLTSTTAGSADINLNAYGVMSLTGTAKVTAGQVTLDGAMLDMSGTAKLTATAGDLTASNAAGITMTGGALSIGSEELTLDTGAEMNLSGSAAVTAGQVTLTDATLKMQGGTLTASGQVTLTDAALTLDGGTLDASAQGLAVKAAGIKMTGGTLNNGEHVLALGSGTSMELSGSAAVTAGQVTLTDATLKMQGGTLTATGGDLVVTKSSPEVALADEGDAEKTYDVSVTGGTLDIGGQTLDLGSGTSMELSGGQVTAGQVKLENAALDMAGNAVLTASGQVELAGSTLTMEGGTLNASAQGLAVQAAGIKMTGGTLNNGEHALALGSDTSLELSGSAAVTAGQVTLTDATLKMQGGTLTATGGDLVVTKSSPEVALADEDAAEKTYDVAISGGTLDIGTKTLDLGSGTSMELSGGQVTAGQVTLDAATLEMGGTAKLTATSGGLSVVNAGGISMTGGTLDIGSNKLELRTGAEMDMSGGQVTADQVALTGAKLTIGGEAQVEALGGIEAQKAELVMQGGSLNAGTLVLVDATLQMDAGVIDASTGGVSLSDSASLVLNGGSLNVGENHIELGADMKLSLGESALVSAGKITVNESATFSVSAASSGKTAAPLAQTLTPVDNMDPTLKGAMLSADLELKGGATYDATGGSVSLGGHELTLSTSDASKINLVLTLDSLSDPDAQIIIFSDVAMVNFLFNLDGAPVVAGEDGNVSVSASNYFDNDWKDDYYINFDKAAGLVYLSSGLPSGPSEPGATPGTPAVPEPSSTALGLMALAGLAMRRRRK